MVSCSTTNRFVQRLLRANSLHSLNRNRKKYTEYCLKGEVANTLYGQPFEHTGGDVLPMFPVCTSPHPHILTCIGHIAIRHDSRIHKENAKRLASIKLWEFWLGDKAYVGCPEYLTESKKPIGGQLTALQTEWNLMIQHYRGRNEHLVNCIKRTRAALNTRWRGSYAGVCSVMHIAAHMTSLQERMHGPRYDVYGPWPHI